MTYIPVADELYLERKFLRVNPSGFAAFGHADDLWILFALAPKAKQHQIGFAETELVRSRAPVVENVRIKKRVQLRDGNVEFTGSFCFCIKFFQRLQRFGHFGFRILKFRNAGEQVSCTFSLRAAKSGKLPHTSSQ